MTSNTQHANRTEKPAESKAREAERAKAELRTQELTDKELGAVTGGAVFPSGPGRAFGGGGGAGRS